MTKTDAVNEGVEAAYNAWAAAVATWEAATAATEIAAAAVQQAWVEYLDAAAE